MGYHKSSAIFRNLLNSTAKEWIKNQGVLASAFPIAGDHYNLSDFNLEGDFVTLSNDFNNGKKTSPFENTGICIDGEVTTLKSAPSYSGITTNLASVLQNGEVTGEFFIQHEELAKWGYLKGSKKEMRTTKDGYQYHYSEGGMPFPDVLHKPSRTIITGEGGKSPSRFKHVVATPKGLRRLTPIELERLNGFPDNHTKLEGISDAKRAFFMGNALVVGVVKKIGASLISKIEQSR